MTRSYTVRTLCYVFYNVMHYALYSGMTHLYTYMCYVMCVLPLTFLCVMLHWHCVCDAGNGVAVSVNDIIIKLVATTL